MFGFIIFRVTHAALIAAISDLVESVIGGIGKNRHQIFLVIAD